MEKHKINTGIKHAHTTYSQRNTHNLGFISSLLILVVNDEFIVKIVFVILPE